MKFKVGDKVKVRKDLENGYFGIANLKQYQKNKVFTISRVFEDKTYFLLEDKRMWWFRENMLIPVEEGIILKGVKNEQGFYEMELPKNLVLVGSHFVPENIRILEFKEKQEILDEKEKEYLRAVIRPFRNRVKYISKKTYYEKEFIEICVNGEFINFPYFKKGTMYKGMGKYKEYTLEELGL